MLTALIREAQRETATRGVQSPSMSLEDVFAALFDTHFTGRIAIDFKEGRIACFNIPSDIKIRVT